MLRLKNTESFLFSLWVLYLCYLFLFLFSYVLVMKFRKVECELWNLSCVSACLSWLISFSLQERALISFDVPYAIPFKKYQVCPYSPTLTRGHSHGPNVRACTISKEDVDTPNMHTDRVPKHASFQHQNNYNYRVGYFSNLQLRIYFKVPTFQSGHKYLQNILA